MNALLHVNHFQPVLDLVASIVKIAVLTVIDMFLLQRAHEAFDQAILGGTGFVGHADFHTAFQQAVGVQPGGVLRPLVGMENRRCAMRQGHVQRIQGELLVNVTTERPASHGTGIGIQDNSEVDKAPAQTDVGDVYSLNANDKNEYVHLPDWSE